MILSSLVVFLNILVIYGYSLAFKFIFFKTSLQTKYYDFIYGILTLFFISSFLNFFIALKEVSLFIYTLGLIIFLFGFIKNLINIKLLFLFISSIFFIILSFGNSPLGDTNFYHLQSLKWIIDYKISFGLVNLEERLGYSTLFTNLISVINLNIFNFNTYYFFNISIFVIFFNQVFELKKISSIGDIFLILASMFLFLFSLIHPDKNGILFNYLGSIEYDTIVCLLFINLISNYLNFFKNKDISNLNLIIAYTVCLFLIRINYSLVILTLFFIYYNNYKLIFYNFSFKIFCFFLFLIYFLKNLIISSCLIFPIKFLCFENILSLPQYKLQKFINIAKSFPRSAPTRERSDDFNYTLETNEWLNEWFFDYLISTSFTQITLFLFFSSLFFMLFKKVRMEIIKGYNLFLLTLILFLLIIFFQAPEIRYGWSLFIFLGLYIFSIFIFNENFRIFKFFKNKYKFIIYSLFTCLLFKNFLLIDLSSIGNSISLNNIIHSEKEFELIRVVNGYKVFKGINGECFDLKEICINYRENEMDFQIKNKKNYLYFIDHNKIRMDYTF